MAKGNLRVHSLLCIARRLYFMKGVQDFGLGLWFWHVKMSLQNNILGAGTSAVVKPSLSAH
jgi:hypothetical protein